MGSSSPTRAPRKQQATATPEPLPKIASNVTEPGASDSRFDRKFREIAEHATAVFFDKGYEGASMRDLSRVSGMSLAGLYYYFESKEKLLYLIQRHTFHTVITRLRERLDGVSDPEQRLRVFIENHLQYFLANMKAMKVLAHEATTLRNSYGDEIANIKRGYYKLCRELVGDVQRSRGIQSAAPNGASRGVKNGSSKGAERADDAGDARIAALSLFGMMNWIHTWYKPRVDGNAEQLAQRMGDIFLKGLLRSATPGSASKSQGTRAKS